MRALLKYSSTKIFNLQSIQKFNFSEFKNKFEKFQNNNYEKASKLYEDMSQFEKTLSYIEKLKYKKAVEALQKKIKKILRKQAESSSQQTYNETNPSSILKQFSPQISYEFFYGIENQKYKPIDQSLVLNKKQLPQLFLIVCGKNSSFLKYIGAVNNTILSNPSVNQTLYSKIQKRCQYFQQQLCLNVYQQYQQTTIQIQQSLNIEKNRGSALKNLKGTKKSNEVFTKDFKFIIKNSLTPQQNYYASQIAKTLTKYNFSTDKTKMFSIKSLSNQGYRSLTPASLKNHLYVLAFHKYQIPEFNDNLFKLFDIFVQQNKKISSIQFVGKTDYMNSLLFYILSNKIENYQLIKSIYMKIVQTYASYIKNLQKQNIKESIENLIKSIDSIDVELFAIMLGILQTKYELSPKNLKQDFKGTDLQFLSYQSISKFLPKLNSNAHQDFQRYLTKKQYKYEKSYLEGNQIGPAITLTSDKIYQIEQKKFICLHLTRLNIVTKKTNGIGELILQYFKFLGDQIKIINPLILNQCEKWGQKQEYFKSKLKGITQPESTKKKRYDI